MPRLPVPGADDDNWGAILNEYLLVSHELDGRQRHVVNVRDFGAKGDGVTDDWSAFQSALASMKNIAPDHDASGGGVLLIPAGNYFLSKTLELAHRVELLGVTGRDGLNAFNYTFTVNGNGMVTHPIGMPGAMSRLLFPAGVTGIKIALGGPAKGGGDAGLQYNGSGSILRNLCLQAADRSNYTPSSPAAFAHGVSVKALVIIDNCSFFNFAGNGLHFVAPSDPPPDYDPADNDAFFDLKHPQLGNLYKDNTYTGSADKIVQYNANTIDSQISNVYSFGNLLNGVYVMGSNSGNMLFQFVHSANNGRYGFFDSERSTGNTYINCYSDSNGSGDYFHLGCGLIKQKNPPPGGSQYEIAHIAGSGALYLNCYQEGLSSTIYAPATILEGPLGLDGYNSNPIDTEFQSNYLALTGIALPDTFFTGRSRPSVIRQSGSETFASTEIPFGVHVYGGDHNHLQTIPTVSVDLGGSQPGVALALSHDLADRSHPQKLYLDSLLSNWWTLSNGTGLPPLRFSTNHAKWGNNTNIQADDNHIWLQRGLFLGNLRQDPPDSYAHRPNFVGNAWTKPTDAQAPMLGGWQQGDIVWNMNPSPASSDVSQTYAGWMCTAAAAAATPSQWAGFGKLEAL